MKSIAVIFIALAVFTVAFPITCPAGTLAVPVLYQQQELWCWAACSQMILSYYGYSSTQCAMANWCFYQSTCCSNGSSYSCNQPNWIYTRSRDMQDVLVNWGPIYGVGQDSALSGATVQSESNAGRPFVIGFTWTSGGGHALVGRGYSGTDVYYNDPWPGKGYMYANYNWVVSAAGHFWDESYRLTTSPPGPPPPPTSARAPLQLYAADFTGDNYSNIAIFRPSTGLWSIRGWGRAYFGRSGDIPVPADYNGDGKADIAIFRPSSGLWSVRGLTQFYFGRSGDIPLPASYHTGYLTAGIFRPSTGLWAWRGGSPSYFGKSGDIPVPGPYANRSGSWGPAYTGIFRPSTGLWSIKKITQFYFGRSGDIPVPGDYQTSYEVSTRPWRAAIFRPATGLWSIRGIGNYYHGRSGDIPVPADYKGGWGDEIAIFRAATGLWSIRGYQPIYFGRTGDLPAVR